jgi:nicotinamidase-related amidase
VAEIAPAGSVLLLMDFQNRILERLGDAVPPLLERAQKARAAARAADMAVMHVRVAFSDADYAAIPVTNKTFHALTATRALTEGTPEATIHPALAPAADEEVFTKTRVGAFTTTSLEARLKARGLSTMILAGVATSGVILSTVRDAADRDWRLIVIGDCCADSDPELHRVLTEKLFPRQADVIDLDEFIKAVAP